MKMPRFTVRRMMGIVAIAAFASLTVATVCREYPLAEHRVAVLVGCVAAGAYGVWAMRHPMVSLAPILVIWLVTSVDHLRFDLSSMSAGGCLLGWMVGAPAGCISRRVAKARPIPAPAPSETTP